LIYQARQIRPEGPEAVAMHQNDGKELVAEARKIARQAESWITLANALADPTGGLIARYFPDPGQRQAFLRSPEYEQLNQLLLRTIKRTGLYPRRAGKKSASAG
jgi:hypothetical protein